MKILTLLLTSALSLLMLSSCEQITGKKSNPAQAAQQVPDPIPVPAPPPPLPHPEPPPVLETPTPPEISFAFNEWIYDGTNAVNLELNLSKVSAVPVTVDVLLIDGTAIYLTDYVGFTGSSANDLKITVTFEPQQTHIDIPAIAIAENANCNVEFTAKLVKKTIESTVLKDSSSIKMPCL